MKKCTTRSLDPELKKMNEPTQWPYGNLLLRVSLGLFLFLWGLDKLIATEDTVRIFSHFYKLGIGSAAAVIIGLAEMVLALCIGFGYKRKLSYLIGLIIHAISTLSSWQQLIDPWGRIWGDGKNSHLFLASIPVLAAFFVLYMNRYDDRWTLDQRCKKTS